LVLILISFIVAILSENWAIRKCRRIVETTWRGLIYWNLCL